jgi:hypothetical protein
MRWDQSNGKAMMALTSRLSPRLVGRVLEGRADGSMRLPDLSSHTNSDLFLLTCFSCLFSVACLGDSNHNDNFWLDEHLQ